jgi:exosortase
MGVGPAVNWLGLAAAACALGWLWCRLIAHLGREWTLNPQYGYGWAVPFLCVYLLVRKAGNGQDGGATPEQEHHAKRGILLGGFLALAYAVTRFIEEANPDWRLVSWALALEVCGLTFLWACSSFRASGPVASRLLFPLLFFLVAVPWPTLIERPLVQGLTRANTAAAVEMVNWCGVPALQHGNMLEVADGLIGIDEACSGIRSFQAALMLSLFFGEYYRLKPWPRAGCVAAGLAFSFLFNVVRTTLLTLLAARQGVATLERWHDPAGVSILMGCFVAIWALARKLKAAHPGQNGSATGFPMLRWARARFEVRGAGLALLVWVVGVEVGTLWWYRAHESELAPNLTWRVELPRDKAGFREVPFTEKTRRLLRYSEGLNASWEQDGHWQAIFLRWEPGRTAARLAMGHTPETCLTAAGCELLGASEPRWLAVKGLRLPVRFYTFNSERGPLHVLYCLWQDRSTWHGFASASLTWHSRLAAVTAGLRNQGQRSLELAFWGGSVLEEETRTALESEFAQLVCPEPPEQVNAGASQ